MSEGERGEGCCSIRRAKENILSGERGVENMEWGCVVRTSFNSAFDTLTRFDKQICDSFIFFVA